MSTSMFEETYKLFDQYFSMQVGVLKKLGNDFYLESKFSRTAISAEQVARVTEEFTGGHHGQ